MYNNIFETKLQIQVSVLKKWVYNKALGQTCKPIFYSSIFFLNRWQLVVSL